jgi:uncharacterized protein (TIGR00251 family)
VSFYRWDGPDLVIEAQVQPRASRDGFAEALGGRLKIRLTAPPVEGKANEYLIGWLARQFGIPKSAVSLESGPTGRRKRLRIRSPKLLPSGLGIVRPGGE